MNILFGISTLLFGIYKFILLWSEWHFISIGNLDVLEYNIGLNIVGLIIAGIMFLIISAHYFFGWKFNLTAFSIIALAAQFSRLILGLFERNIHLNTLFEIHD